MPDQTDDHAHEQRVRERAYHLWEQAGRPHGRDTEFWERARALVAIEENPDAGQMPNPEVKPPPVAEEASVQQNLATPPDRMTDQGERPQTPLASRRRRRS